MKVKITEKPIEKPKSSLTFLVVQNTIEGETDIRRITPADAAELLELAREGITIDDILSDSSENPVQNKVLKAVIDDLTRRIKALENGGVAPELQDVMVLGTGKLGTAILGGE